MKVFVTPRSLNGTVLRHEDGLVQQSKDKVIPMIWKVNDNCTACGTCADVCPVDPTLYVINDKAVYQEARADECTECYACVDSCPEGAIEE